MTDERPKTAARYRPEWLAWARALCLELTTVIGGFLESDVTIVGGLVPPLLIQGCLRSLLRDPELRGGNRRRYESSGPAPFRSVAAAVARHARESTELRSIPSRVGWCGGSSPAGSILRGSGSPSCRRSRQPPPGEWRAPPSWPLRRRAEERDSRTSPLPLQISAQAPGSGPAPPSPTRAAPRPPRMRGPSEFRPRNRIPGG